MLEEVTAWRKSLLPAVDLSLMRMSQAPSPGQMPQGLMLMVDFTLTSPGYLIRDKVTCSAPEGDEEGN